MIDNKKIVCIQESINKDKSISIYLNNKLFYCFLYKPSVFKPFYMTTFTYHFLVVCVFLKRFGMIKNDTLKRKDYYY